MENDFLNKINEIIEENISNEKFGVSELAREIGMSRSNLLRKIQKLTKLSVSQYIRQVRVNSAMEMLRETSWNVSEVSYKVGFSSTSYFIKCFREHYGYPPGEVGNRTFTEVEPTQEGASWKRKIPLILGGSFLVFCLAAVLYIIFKPAAKPEELEKSIAVLPFRNDSNDSSNVHIVNGLMESILNNLQNIEEFRVISRRSVEKYRNSEKTIPEIAKELNVSYCIEGSGQKIENEIMLNVQLIEGQTDKNLWSEQYSRGAEDIFNLQNEVARKIADRIEVIITPEEQERINKVPTDNLIAYDYFLKGLDLFYEGTPESLAEAITYYKTAIEYDGEFARAYAGIAISYYFLDVFQAEKKYSDLINNYADKALLYDSRLPQSLIAKAVYYMNGAEFELAIPYLEKALEYNPNSALVINILSDFYTSYVPDTEKYLEYALKGISLDIAANDSTTASYIYLHLSNAFMQSGFLKEAEYYISKSFDYFPGNLYSEQLNAYIQFAKYRDLHQTKDILVEALHQDSSRLDIIQEIGKIYYYMRDYETSYKYYGPFIEIVEEYNLDIYPYEFGKIGVVLSEMGLTEKSEAYFNYYKQYADNSTAIYKDLNLALYYSYKGETDKAIEKLELFSEQNNFQYWVILFYQMDPLVDNIRDHPEFNNIFEDLETKFWENNKRIRTSLHGKGLL